MKGRRGQQTKGIGIYPGLGVSVHDSLLRKHRRVGVNYKPEGLRSRVYGLDCVYWVALTVRSIGGVRVQDHDMCR